MAAAWASQVTGIALEMVVPPVLGLWIDHKLGTGFVFVTLGGVLGLYAAIRSLLRVAHAAQGEKGNRAGKDCAPPTDRNGK